MPDIVFQLSDLGLLWVSVFEEVDLREIHNLSYLWALCIYNCKGIEFYESMGELKDLSYLSMSDCDIKSFPPLEGSTSLEILSLDRCLFTEIPEWVHRLPNLLFVSLYDSLITEMPDSIGKLVKHRGRPRYGNRSDNYIV